jgi:hypothetical protein
MKINEIILFLILGLVIVVPSFSSFDCKLNLEDKCVNNTICADSGLCACPQFYYGHNCEKLLPDSKTLSINTEGITSGSYLGIIAGLVVSLPVFLVVGLLIIFFSLKNREY